MATTQKPPQAPMPEPECALYVLCMACGDGVEVLMPIEHKAIAVLLAQRGWHMPMLKPPSQGPEAPALFGVHCATCVPKLYPPEMLKAAEEHRQMILKMTLAPQPPQAR